MDKTVVTNAMAIGTCVIQNIHTTEMRFLVQKNESRILQYRNAVLVNGFSQWDEWKNVPMIFEQKETE